MNRNQESGQKITALQLKPDCSGKPAARVMAKVGGSRGFGTESGAEC